MIHTGPKKISDEDVKNIRNAKKQGAKSEVLAKQYGLHRSTIDRITSGERRYNVKDVE